MEGTFVKRYRSPSLLHLQNQSQPQHPTNFNHSQQATMKTSTIFTTLSLLLTPLALAAPAPRFPTNGCVCVTAPCPCAGDPPEDLVKMKEKRLTADRDWCAAHPTECRVALGIAPMEVGKREEVGKDIVIGSRDGMGMGKRMPPVDPLKWCLDHWEECKANF